ncbi:MAG TPA: Holliday junction branch migration DNA helicase RuvB [Nitrospinota bacterium]|nr:Holliday junction branch migration DNA helicase RuvB [Nitrospinota bacterium]
MKKSDKKLDTEKDSLVISKEDRSLDLRLRPRTFDEYIGQEKIKESLKIFIQAARERSESLDHVLLYGPPGLGKTTLAHIISFEMKVNIRSTSGPLIDRTGDLAAILTNLADHDILFIDEIHRLPHIIEEMLYSAMEDFKLDIIIGQGPSAKTVKLDLPRFTLIGATTRAGLLTSPLRDRFGVIHRIEYYNKEELLLVVKRSADILGIQIDHEGASEIAKRARGTPRVANRILKRVRDFAQVKEDGKISKEVAKRALQMLEVDESGLDKMDRKLLLTIIEKFNGGPVGIETLATALNEEKDTIEDIYEPFLIQCGYMCRTQRGRVTTPLAYKHLGICSQEDNSINNLQEKLL